MSPNDFQEPDNGSDINNLWCNFWSFYNRNKEGLQINITRTKEKITGVWFKYTRRF